MGRQVTWEERKGGRVEELMKEAKKLMFGIRWKGKGGGRSEREIGRKRRE